MDFFEQGKKDLAQETELEILQKQKHEQVFIGSVKKSAGTYDVLIQHCYQGNQGSTCKARGDI